MKRIALIFALVLTFAGSTFAASLPAQLSKKQLASLIASAKTPSEHERIADYYRAASDRLLAEANEHAKMAAAFRANPATNNDKTAHGTVNHCDYLVQTLKAESVRARVLAEDHERMAQAAGLAKAGSGSR